MCTTVSWKHCSWDTSPGQCGGKEERASIRESASFPYGTGWGFSLDDMAYIKQTKIMVLNWSKVGILQKKDVIKIKILWKAQHSTWTYSNWQRFDWTSHCGTACQRTASRLHEDVNESSVMSNNNRLEPTVATASRIECTFRRVAFPSCQSLSLSPIGIANYPTLQLLNTSQQQVKMGPC